MVKELQLAKETLQKGFANLCTAKAMADLV